MDCITETDAGFDARLLAAAQRHLNAVRGAVELADPHGSVRPRSRLLCAGLACLAEACYRALGGRVQVEAVGQAAALLSLLTKIDDQVIDALAFHGGPLATRDPRALDARTRAYLAPTLASLASGRPANGEARCQLAATLGRSLRELAGTEDRHAHLMATIRFGWEVQVRAVRLLSTAPERVEGAAIEAVTADISGAWLLMITMIGQLPADAERPLSAGEIAAFYRWGRHIQAADALSDLRQDTADGLVASLPNKLLTTRVGSAPWRRAFATGELASLAAALVDEAIDRSLMPQSRELGELDWALAGLGDIPAWLRWIHGFLTWRWLDSPLCQRAMVGDSAPAGFPPPTGRALATMWRDGPAAAMHTQESWRCSAR